jgi:hypothetical protein
LQKSFHSRLYQSAPIHTIEALIILKVTLSKTHSHPVMKPTTSVCMKFPLPELLTCGLLLVPTVSYGQTTANAGIATAPTNGTAASGSTAGTFLDMSLAGSWSSGVPTSSTEAIFSGGHLGTSSALSANKLTLGNGTNLYGASYQSSATTGAQTITLGSGGLTTGASTDSRIGPNLTLAVGSINQSWTIPTSRILNYQGLVSGNGTITLDGAGTLWKRDAASAGFTGVWNVTNGILRVESRFGIGNTAASVALSNDATLRISTASTDFNRNLSIGSGGGKLLASVSGVVFTGAISGSNTLTLQRSASHSFTVGSDMTDHVGAIAIDRTTSGTTMNFGNDSIQAKFSFDLGLNGIVDGINTSAGSSSALIRGGSGANDVTVNFANSLFDFDLSSASTTDGNFWNIVDVANLTETFGAAFSVTSNLGAFSESGNVWTKINGLSTWTFSESTGRLEVFTAVPEPTSALAGLLVTAGLLRRRRG